MESHNIAKGNYDMRKNDDFDGQTAGQMTIQDVFTPPERLLAVSRVFARAKRDMTLAEQKAFAYAKAFCIFKLLLKNQVKVNSIHLFLSNFAMKSRNIMLFFMQFYVII